MSAHYSSIDSQHVFMICTALHALLSTQQERSLESLTMYLREHYEDIPRPPAQLPHAIHVLVARGILKKKGASYSVAKRHTTTASLEEPEMPLWITRHMTEEGRLLFLLQTNRTEDSEPCITQ